MRDAMPPELKNLVGHLAYLALSLFEATYPLTLVGFGDVPLLFLAIALALLEVLECDRS